MPNSRNLPLPNPPDLVVKDEQVHDQVTGLVWTRDFSPLTDWAGAQEYCEVLAQRQGSEWRLPTRIELVSILEQTTVPSIDPVAFPETPADYFWSRTPVPGREDARYSLYFGVGETAFGTAEQSGAQARCVRDGRHALSPHLEIDADLVLDTATGLGWQRTALAEPVSLEVARLVCEALVLGGRTGFRVPSSKELQTLIEPALSPAAVLIDAEAFPETPGDEFWSDEGPSQSPRQVDFGSGVARVTDLGDMNFVRCVL